MPAPPAGWRWERRPAGRMGEPLLAQAAGEQRALYRPEEAGFSLAYPYSERRPFPLTPLFSFCLRSEAGGGVVRGISLSAGRLSAIAA